MAAKASTGDSTPPGDSGTQAAEGSTQPGDGAAATPAAAPDAPDGSTAAPDGAPAPDPAVPDDAKAPGTPDTTPAAAPLTPPIARATATVPGTPVTEPNAAIRQAPDGGHLAIVDQDGEPLDPDGLFAESVPHHTFLEAARDIFQKFRYPGQQRETTTHSMQLVARAGTKIPRDKAHEIIETARNGGTPAGDSESAGAAE
jgi:hypothetical protein